MTGMHTLATETHSIPTTQPARMFALCATLLFAVSAPAYAGPLDSPAPPTDPGSAMFRLEDLYNRLDTGAQGAPSVFAEPSAGPGSTGHSLNQVMGKAPATNAAAAVAGEVLSGKVFWGLLSGAWGQQTGTRAVAPAAKTGQTTSYATGDDGDLKKGVAWPSPRFTDNANGTVTDNLTGLIWLKNANFKAGTRTWANALTDCATLNSGEGGLTDGSVEGDWRLPNVQELQSLIDYGKYYPALPAGHPFTGVKSLRYSSGTTYASNTTQVLSVDLNEGRVLLSEKAMSYYVWPVRGGE